METAGITDFAMYHSTIHSPYTTLRTAGDLLGAQLHASKHSKSTSAFRLCHLNVIMYTMPAFIETSLHSIAAARAHTQYLCQQVYSYIFPYDNIHKDIIHICMQTQLYYVL